MKTVEAFDFSPHKDEQPVQIDGAQFVSRKEFDDFAAKVNAVLGAADGIHGHVQATPATTPVTAVGGAVQDGSAPLDAQR
jgi:hypothetical protein